MRTEGPKDPLVVAIDMGYGHLRPAHAIADALGCRVLHADKPPLADAAEQRTWARTRTTYEVVSRLSQMPVLGAPIRRVLDAATDIPHLFPLRDLSAPTAAARLFDRLIERDGLGRGMVERMRRDGAPLVTTFYAPALIASRAGCRDAFCVVTDSDVNRVWAPADAARTTVTYLVPSARCGRRLTAYGVPPERIRFTGFPLPHELLGGPDLSVLRRNLAARLVRLDPEGAFRAESGSEIGHFLGPLPQDQEGVPPLVTFAIGGAGAQAGLVELAIPSFRDAVLRGRVRLAFVAGVRAEVEARFREAIRRNGLDESLASGAVRVLREPTFEAYLASFNRLLSETDALWTKPSELVFFGALGLPLVVSWPVGVHERYNRRWAMERGAAVKARDPVFLGDRVAEWLADGTLAAAAWSGYTRLPKFGLYRVLEEVGYGHG